MIRFCNRWLRIAVAAVSLAAASASATTVIAKSFRSLSTEAEAVFAATVQTVESYRRDNGRIWTAVRFTDIDWLAGTERSEIELHFAGGRVGDRAEVVGGMPQFVAGQRVLLFIRDQGTASPVVGFHQGCFDLRESEAGERVRTIDNRPVLGVDGDDLLTGEVGEAGGLTVGAFGEIVSELRAREARP